MSVFLVWYSMPSIKVERIFMMIKPLLMGLVVVALSGVLAACQTAPDTPEVEELPPVEEVEVMPEETVKEMNLVETAASAGQFNTLLELATTAGLAEALSTENVTIFAPTDEAFAKLPSDTLKMLQDDSEKLAEVLKYHVVAGAVPASQVVASKTLDTLQGEPITVTVTGETVQVNDSTVLMTDVTGSNGVIHVIDAVMMPPSM